jgi:hypothetical protein
MNECDHIMGWDNRTLDDSYLVEIYKLSDQTNFKLDKNFKFCPNYGEKINYVE